MCVYLLPTTTAATTDMHSSNHHQPPLLSSPTPTLANLLSTLTLSFAFIFPFLRFYLCVSICETLGPQSTASGEFPRFFFLSLRHHHPLTIIIARK